VISDETFWLVAFALYFVDNIKLLDTRDLIIRETLLFRWKVHLVAIPFLVRGRCLVLLNPFMPHCMAFKMRWLNGSGTDVKSLRSDRKFTLGLQRRVVILRCVVYLSFVSLFAVGPVLTSRVGLGVTLLALAPIHLLLAGTAAGFILLNQLAMTKLRLTSLILECAVCPMYLPSLVRRISWHSILLSDGIAFARSYIPSTEREELTIALKTRGEELLDTCDREEERQLILRYLDWAMA